MASVGTRPKTVLQCLAAILLFANICVAQPATNFGLTLNGPAKILTGPDGGFEALWLTPAEIGQAGSAFTTNK
jgi:hypothetical protein